jgi:dihydroflavonol-4-reductase
MKVVVTGANGFLGSWLTKRLSSDGYDIHIVARQNSDLSDLQGLKYKTWFGDVTDLKSLENAFEGAEQIFHLAGVVAYKKSQRELMDKVNFQGTQNVIQAMKAKKIKKLLHLSSVVAVGAGFTSKEILNEDSEYNLEHLNLGYFETKRKAEQAVVTATKKSEIEGIIVNPSTIYGPADAKKGSRSIQLKVAQGRFPFYTGGGVNVVSVHDVINGIMLAIKKGKPAERYILSADNWTIQKLFQQIAFEAQVKAPHIKLPDLVLHTLGSLGDCAQALGFKGGISKENAWTSTLFHWFDNSKAKKELGFSPGTAEAAIHASVEWIKQQGMLIK